MEWAEPIVFNFGHKKTANRKKTKKIMKQNQRIAREYDVVTEPNNQID